MFAIVIKKIMDLHARERIAIVNPEGIPSLPSRARHASGQSVQGPKRYNRLFNSSFAFCRWAAIAPPVLICSTESVVPEAGVEIVWSWL